MESPHADNDFLAGIHLVYQTSALINKLDTIGSRRSEAIIRKDLADRCIEQDVQVGPVLRLPVETVKARTPAIFLRQCSSPLLDANPDASVEFVDDGDVGRLAGPYESGTGLWDVALEAELQGSVAIGAWVPCLE